MGTKGETFLFHINSVLRAMQTPQNTNKYISEDHFNFKQQKLHAHIHVYSKLSAEIRIHDHLDNKSFKQYSLLNIAMYIGYALFIQRWPEAAFPTKATL